MGGYRQLDKYIGQVPSFTAAYVSLPLCSGEYYSVTSHTRMSIPMFSSGLGCQK